MKGEITMYKDVFKTVSAYTFFAICVAIPISNIAADAKDELKNNYEYVCQTPSDIYQHIPILHDLCKECSSVTEIGIRGIVSTWGCLQGLAENSTGYRSYLGIDIASPPINNLVKAQTLAIENGIDFTFWQVNDMTIELPYTDLLFIDSLHTYCHLTYELETFSSNVGKYIAMHDTSAPWGNQDDSSYRGDYSEYPAEYDRTKRGLWPAVEDFLARHPEWKLKERRFNNHGFTVLERV